MTILKKIESIHAIKQGFIDNDDESKKKVKYLALY